MDNVQINTGLAGPESALIPIMGALVLVHAVLWYSRFRHSITWEEIWPAACWLIPSFSLLTVLAIICGLNLYVSQLSYLVVSTFLLVGFGALTLFRLKSRSLLSNLGDLKSTVVIYIRDAVIILCLTCISFLVLELPWNDRLFSIAPFHVFINLVVISIPILVLYFWGGFQGVWLTLPLVAYSCLGIAQYYVGLFRGNLIRPSDILAAGTALSVSGGYSYEIGAYQVLALGVSGIGFALLAFMFPLRHGEKRGSGYFAKRFVARFGGGIAVIVAAVLAFSNISFSQDLCLSDDYWDYLNVCRGQGYAASFVMLLQNALIVPPEDYSAHSAELLVEDYVERYNTTIGNGKSRQEAVAQFESEQPTVIAIMNEAFSDLSIYNGLEANYQGPTQIKGISDALYTGYVFSSVVGGGTCNSEFEFLSGASMRFIGADNMAYVMYNLSDAPALPKQLALSGYEATAIHPNDRMNWNRSAVYEQMGFDQFLDITAFDDDAPTRHMGISDSATYELILELMESSDKPQFIFDVTMQNHSSYGQLDLSDSELVELDTDWFSGDFYTEIKEYISLIEASERELMDFLDELRSINRPVVVVFFGDHQPSQGSVLNQWMSPDADVSDPNYYERPYQVPYIIWANYDVAGNDQVSERLDMGIQSLGPILLNAIGAPLTDWQMASLSALEEVPVLNGYGYRTADGVWHSFDGDSEVVRAVRDLEWMQYLEYETHL